MHDEDDVSFFFIEQACTQSFQLDNHISGNILHWKLIASAVSIRQYSSTWKSGGKHICEPEESRVAVCP
jgi:hypothetical protein